VLKKRIDAIKDEAIRRLKTAEGEEILVDSSPNNRQKIVSRSARQPGAAEILNCVLPGRRFTVYRLGWAFSSRTWEMWGFSG
jgi:hypothetical protein